jgi:hypothetical protein
MDVCALTTSGRGNAKTANISSLIDRFFAKRMNWLGSRNKK